MYGLPKIHKENFPLRPIVSYVDSPTYNAAQYLVQLLHPLQAISVSALKNSYDLKEKCETIKCDSNDRLISFDVCNLFTSIPFIEAMNMALQRLSTDSSLNSRTKLTMTLLHSLFTICGEATTFQAWQKIYSSSTCPMGSPLSPILANIFMETLEDSFLQTLPTTIKIWKRYVDDIFAIIPVGSEQTILDHMNS